MKHHEVPNDDYEPIVDGGETGGMRKCEKLIIRQHEWREVAI